MDVLVTSVIGLTFLPAAHTERLRNKVRGGPCVHHEPRSCVPLDPVYHIIYPGDHFVWALL
jgi:hypothetical protein